MDSDYISNLCASLSLDEEEDTHVPLSDDQKLRERARLGRCLVGKDLCAKVVNRDAFNIAMIRAWSTVKDVVIESLEENKFIFYFSNGADKRRVVLDRPWNFNTR